MPKSEKPKWTSRQKAGHSCFLQKPGDSLLRQCRSLFALAQDEAASKGEKERALQIIENYKKELYNNSMLIKIDKQIDHIEEQKRRLIVRELSFNSYYEFALERIPQIVAQEKIQFNIRDFAAILKQFYRGGELR